MKKLIKTVLFIFIFVILLILATNILVLKGNYYGTDVISFYKVPKNTLDIIFLGSSHSYATFSPEIIKNQTGMNSYNFATQQQPTYITYHYMVEALKYQKPKYFIVEARMFAVDDEFTSEGVIRDAIDKMRLSKNKIEAISVSVPNKSDRISYYFNIIKYHSRYKDITKDELIDGLLYRGINTDGFIALDPNNDVIINNKDIIKNNNTKKISKKNLLYLNKMIKLADKENIKLIFVKSPCQLTNKDQEKYNWLTNYLNKKGIEFINYNLYEKELHLIKGDFYDAGHLSYTGAKKLSEIFSSYIIKQEKK